MNFERKKILEPILDNLEGNDQTLFISLQQKVLADLTVKRHPLVSSSTVELIFQALRDELTKRGDAILSEMENVLKGAYIEDFDKLAESLKAELMKRLESAVRLATSEFLSSTESIRSRINHPNMPSETALSGHVDKLKAKWLAKVDLICENLRATQMPRSQIFSTMRSSPTKPPIFISHASEDREIVTKLIDALNNGLHLPGGTFFCSSVPGMGIPNGRRFIDYIRETIDETKLVIFLISPAFLESRFCLAESGAAWVKSVDQIILLTPSLKLEDLGGVFQGIQAAKLSDQYVLNELKDRIFSAVSPLPQLNASHWERVRGDFLDYLATLPPPNFESSVKETADGKNDQPLSPSANLTSDAKRMLLAASKDQSGFITAIPSQGGCIIAVGSQQFAELGNAREQAKWEAVLNELELSRFIKPINPKRNAYQITQAGYEVAELLNRENEP